MASDYNSVAASWAGAAAQADNSFRQPLPYDAPAPAPTVFDKVNAASKNRQANAVADSWRKAAEVANQTGSQPPLPEVDGYALAQMAITGSGLESASQIDRDFIQLGSDGFRAKYGDAIGQHYEAAFQSGAAGRRADLTTQRSGAQLAGDTLNTVLSTPVSLLGGIAALGVGGAGYVSQKLGAKQVGDALVSAGTTGSELVGDFTRGAQSLQSDQLNASRKNFAVEQGLRARDNALQAEQDAKTYGNVVAKGLQISRDTIDAFGSLNGNTAASVDTVANAAGSLLGGGVLTKGLRAIGGRVAAAAGDSALAQRAIRIGKATEMPASMVAMEAGSAYQQTVDQALQELSTRTDLTDAQKQDMANKAGLEAASIQAAATAVPMMIPGVRRIFNSEFERNPVAIHSFGKALREVGAETLEEGYQEGSAQLAQNKALQDQTGSKVDIAAGVGDNIALGAIGGLGSAAAFQGPGVAFNAPIAAAKSATALARDFLGRGNPVQTPQGSPVSDTGVQGTTSAHEAPVVSPAPVSARTAATQGDIHVESIIDNNYNGDFRTVRVRDPKTGEVLSMGNISIDKYGNMGPVTLFDNKTQEPLNLSRADAEHIRDLASKGPDMSHLNDFEVIKPEDAQRIEAIHPDAKVEAVPGGLASLNQGVINTLRENGTDIVATINPETKAPEMAVINPTVLAPTNDANHPSTKAAAEVAGFTPKEVADTLSTAQTDPTKVNPDQADKLLFHADEGKINLTPEQRTTLRTGSQTARAARDAATKGADLYGLANADQVSREILTNKAKDDSELGKKSVTEHLTDFRDAMVAGDTEAAKASLTELGFFAQHMANKVDALNRALADGNTSSTNPARYESYVGGGRFRVSGKISQDANGNRTRIATGVHVSPTSENSVRLAQKITIEADAVAGVVNNLSAAFPELGIDPVAVPKLDAALDGDAKQVAARNTEAKAKSEASPAPTSSEESVPQPAQDTQQAPETVAESTAAPVSEADTGVAVDANDGGTPTNDAVPVEPAVDAVQERTLKSLFPALVGTTDNTNRVQSAFELPAEAATRTEGLEKPLQAIADALLNRGAFENFIGRKLDRDFGSAIAAAYSDYLKVGDVLLSAMNDSLRAFLSKNDGSKHSLVSSTSWINGQAVNIVEEHKGEYRYNPALVEGAVLAALNWYLKLSQKTGNLDENDVRQLLRLDADAVLPSGLVDQINNYGVGPAELSRSLAREIQRFWGLNLNPNTPRNHAEGVLEAVAKEILGAMTKPLFAKPDGKGNVQGVGMFQVNEVSIADVTTNEKIDHLNRYSLSVDRINEDGSIQKGERIFEDERLKGFPNAIETAVLVEPEQTTYVGEPPKTVAKTQLRNSAVRLSAKQTKAIEIQQQVPHKLNMPFIEMLNDIGEDMVLRLFGGGKLDPARLNAQHMLSLKGRNLTIQSAYRSIRGMLAEAQSKGDPAEVPVFFAYDTTVVNRQQMLGRDNPQSNKLMREAVLPTWHTLDLTDPKMNELFRLGLAQALGIKVHTQSREQSLAELATKLAGFTETLKILNDKSKLRFNEQAIDTMKAEGIDSPVALHAVMEWNRSQNTENPKAFSTATYFEADGVTNGVVNAMALFSSGSFTGKWLSNIARGGYWVGEQLKSLAELRGDFARGQEDLYGLAGTATTQKINALRAQYAADGNISKQFNAVRDLLVEFLKDVNVNDGQGLDIARGAVKNPLTITIYGSGANGIAGNVVDEVVGKIYEMLSEAAARKADDPSITEAQSIYGGDEASAQIKFDRLMDNLSRLAGSVLTTNKNVLYVDTIKSGTSATFGDPTKFKFSPAVIKNMRQNVLHAYVNPMVEGITDTVGTDLMQTLHVLKTQVQAWSLVGRAAYRQAYAKALAAKGFKSKNDILSIKEEGAVLQSVMDMLPKFDAGDMSFLFGMTQRTEGNTEFGRDFAEQFKTPAWGYTPGNAGVAGIPGMTIGSGDGQAVLNAVTDPEMPAGFLQIFDGIHSSVAEMEQMGQVANRAVFKSWQNNPMAKLAEAFEGFVSKLDISKLDLTEEDRKELTKSLFSDWYSTPSRSNAELQNALEHFAKVGTKMGAAISERQAVMARVQSSVDQMAGAASPHQNFGIILSGSAEQKAALLEAMRDPEVADILEGKPAPADEPVAENPEAPKLSFKAASVPLLGKLLEKQITKITNDRQTRALLRDVIRSGAVDDFTIHVGSREELISKAVEMGITVPASRTGFMGFMDPFSQSIFVVDGNPETMLHELIHAGTYQKLQAFFDGSDASPELVEAVQRLQGLMDQFKAERLSGDAYQAALDEMERQAAAGNQAGELNEFMAWALANADLAQQLKATKVNLAVKLARSVVQAIKRLIFGGKRSFAVKDDMFTNLRFNTNIVLRVGNPAQSLSDGLLYHDPNFGNDSRVQGILDRIKSKISDYANVDEFNKEFRKQKLNPALVRSATVSQAFQRAGFSMTQQQNMAFIHMLTIMATDAKLDANSTVRLQELFAHVGQHLSVDDFLLKPEENDPNDIEQASKKLDVLMGRFKDKSDNYGRSFVLPAFVALAATNQQFRDILKKIPMPKTKYVGWNSVDNILDNIGDASMDNLSRWVSGEGVRTADTQAALDNLMEQMLQTTADSQLFIEKFTNPIGDGIDRVNQAVVDGVKWLGGQTENLVKHVETALPNSKAALAVAQSLNFAIKMLNEEDGRAAATGLMGKLNGSKLSEPVFNLLKDMIGRTAENGEVYDMIKIARTWVNGIRQQFREQLPKIINSKFTRTLSADEQTNLHRGLGQTGLASLLTSMSIDEVLDVLANKPARDVAIKSLVDRINELSPNNGKLIEQKAKDLAEFMIHKKTQSTNLLRNATAIAHLLNEPTAQAVNTTPEMIEAIDHLVSLLAVNQLSSETQTSLADLAQNESKGMNFMLSYLRGQDELDKSKFTGNARFNHWKGYMPADRAAGVSLVILHDNGADRLIQQGYVRLGDFVGSSRDPSAKKRGYYFLPISGNAPFAQGIMQNVHQTASGVDKATGFSLDMTAGEITEPELVKKISQNRSAETQFGLLPVYDQNGTLFAYERAVDPAIVQTHLKPNTDMAKMMGVRSGRQSEEASANQLNRSLIDALRTMYDKDRKAGRQGEYINLNDTTDRVHKDAMRIFSKETKDYIAARFPEGFYVRRDMVDDAIGYRQASIGDVFTGNSRWSPETQKLVRDALVKMFGTNAYRYAIKAESLIQNFVMDARVILVVKSVIVPMANAASNVYQLIGRGVPMTHIFKAIPKKTAEIESWHKSRVRQIEAEAELLATTDAIERRRLQAEIQTIKDSHKRLSIWPLLEAGEFSHISDAGSREDIALSEGRLGEYIEKAVSKLPKSVQTLGRYYTLSKDTALFRALQKSVAYGDFVAKAVLYDDLTQRKGQTPEQALEQITEEFVNYDRLPGRDRAYLENIGLLWFYNFKLRSAKVALSMIRRNPVHSLMAMSLPMPVRGTGLPLTDNLWYSLFENKLGWSSGFGMAIRAPSLLPVHQLIW